MNNNDLRASDTNNVFFSELAIQLDCMKRKVARLESACRSRRATKVKVIAEIVLHRELLVAFEHTLNETLRFIAGIDPDDCP